MGLLEQTDRDCECLAMKAHPLTSTLAILLAASLSTLGLGCGSCPTGNAVEPAREVTFDLHLQLVGGALLTGRGSSPPDGEGLSFDRTTIAVGGAQVPPPASNDLVMFAMTPSCHPDSTGATVCDYLLRSWLIVHQVAPGTSSIELDDSRAALALSVTPVVTGSTGPCPGKPGLSGCPTTTSPDGPMVAYTGIAGHLDLSELSQDCTDVISSCALAAAGSFTVSASTPQGDAVELASGSLTAADTLVYQDHNSCNP